MTDTLLGIASFVIVAASVAIWVPAIYRVAIPSNRVFFVAVWVIAAALGATAVPRRVEAASRSRGFARATFRIGVTMIGRPEGMAY